MPFLFALRLWVKANPRTALALVILAVFAALLLAVYLRGRADSARQEEARDAVALAEQLKLDTRAKEEAAGTRLQDALAVVQTKKELTDAVAAIPDTVPDPVAVRLGCERLRRQGTDVSKVPACR